MIEQEIYDLQTVQHINSMHYQKNNENNIKSDQQLDSMNLFNLEEIFTKDILSDSGIKVVDENEKETGKEKEKEKENEQLNYYGQPCNLLEKQDTLYNNECDLYIRTNCNTNNDVNSNTQNNINSSTQNNINSSTQNNINNTNLYKNCNIKRNEESNFFNKNNLNALSTHELATNENEKKNTYISKMKYNNEELNENGKMSLLKEKEKKRKEKIGYLDLCVNSNMYSLNALINIEQDFNYTDRKEPLHMNNTDAIQQLEQTSIEEESNEFKLCLMITIFNFIDKKLTQIQKNIMEFAKIVKIEENTQKNKMPKASSINTFVKYTAGIYKKIENKIFKMENADKKDKNINKKQGIKISGLFDDITNNTLNENIHFNNSFPHINDVSSSSREYMFHTDKDSFKNVINHTTFPIKQKQKEENQKEQEKEREKEEKKEESESESESESLNGNTYIQKLIHNMNQSILFNMWLCELQFGNIDDIYTIYIYNLKKKNSIIHIEGPKILKNISDKISTAFMKYINF